MGSDCGHRRWGLGGGSLLVAFACAPEPEPDAEAEDGGSGPGILLSCDDHSECGSRQRCVEAICEPCGDASDPSQPTCPFETVVVDAVRVSRMFQVHPPPAVAVLAVAWNDPRLRLLRPDGSGHVDEHWMLAGSQVQQATTADLDGNGWDDAILGLLNVHHMSPLWLGPDEVTSPGSWTTTPTSAAAALPAQGERPAIVVTDQGEQVEWWYGFEAGLAWGGTLDVPRGSAVVALDLDGDAQPELAAATPDGRVVALHWQDAGFQGTHELSGLAPTHAASLQLRAADVDDDGRDDVLLMAGAVQPLAVIRSGGDGLVLEAILDVEPVQDVVVADFDGDGRSELIVAGTDGLFAFDRDASGRWSGPRILELRQPPRALAPVHVDDDGRVDLLVGTYAGLGVLYGGSVPPAAADPG